MDPIQSGIFVTKPSWLIYMDALQLLELSKQHAAEEKKIQKRIELTHCFARFSFLMFILSVEALANDILFSEFRVVPGDQIPDNAIKKFGIKIDKGVEWCSLSDKIAMLPYLCNHPADWSKSFFDRGSKEFQIFDEIVEIRDTFAHPKPVKRPVEITISKTTTHPFTDDFPENFWPITKIPKDIYGFCVEHAEIAKSTVEWIRSQLNIFLNGKLFEDDWWRKEKIENLVTVKRSQ